MGRRLLTKALGVDQTGAVLVNYAAGRVGGAQVGRVSLGQAQVCVPFSGGSPLPDRKYLVITNVADVINVGVDGLDFADSYILPGANRGTGELPPNLARYSNLKQFLRGQYLSLACLTAVGFCARSINVEIAASLELS